MRRVWRTGEQRKSLGERLLLCMHATCASEVDNTLTRMPRSMAAGPMRRRVFVQKREPQHRNSCAYAWRCDANQVEPVVGLRARVACEGAVDRGQHPHDRRAGGVVGGFAPAQRVSSVWQGRGTRLRACISETWGKSRVGTAQPAACM